MSDIEVEGAGCGSGGRGKRQAAVRAQKRIITKEIELTDSSSSESDDDFEEIKIVHKRKEDSHKESTSGPETDSSRADSPPVPMGQYEIEDVVDFIRDDIGEMYFIKWKNWDSDFNTWEPPGNLTNCDDALLNFYRKRKAEVDDILAKSEYVVMSNGKRRRKGLPLLQVPPDPRPLEVRVKEFYDNTEPIDEAELVEKYVPWNKKCINSKGKDEGIRWPMSKINKSLQDALDLKLSQQQIQDLRTELLYIEMKKRKLALSVQMKEWEACINNITEERPLIMVENNVDFQGPPDGFQFVTDYIPSSGITIPSDPPVGCLCPDLCYENRQTCCAKQFGSHFAYTKYKKINVAIGTPIYECNRKCRCSQNCPNRVVQDGKNDLKLTIFRTGNGCGWGVKSTKSIKRGCFVCLYVGEVITNEEAEKRAKMDGDGHTYLFDLDFNDQENPQYSVDASKFGNVAHFINHSCDPNLGVYAVWVDCLDPNLPKLAMFALRDIAKGEELSFDYTDQLAESKTAVDGVEGSPVKDRKERKKCLCAAPKCRKFLF